jgi:AraC family transcriptional regulator
MSERITLDDVAREVNVSPFHFARIFQKQTGVPVHRYLIQLRLRASSVIGRSTMAASR